MGFRRLAHFVLTWVFLVFAPAQGSAQDDPLSVFAAGIRAYQEANYQTVVSIMHSALDDSHFEGPKFRWVKLDARKFLALALVQLGRPADARLQFQEMLRENPNYQLAESAGRPAVELFNEVKTPKLTRSGSKRWLKYAVSVGVIGAGVATGFVLLGNRKAGAGSSALVGPPPDPPSR